MLGWVGYQYVGTDIVSERAFEQEASGLRSTWQSPSTSKPGHVREFNETPIPGAAIGLLRIPKFGASYEVPILEGTDLSVLARGVGHYPSNAMPGQIGNFAIAGHRVTHGEPFAKLLQLDRGDTVIVETRTAVYTYVLDTAPRDLTVEETANWVLDPVPGRPEETPSKALITLTTCQDLFHSPDRSIGFGHLESSTKKS